MKTRIFAFFMVTALLLAVAPLNGAYLVYTSKSSWISAVGGVYETEDFSDSTLNPGISHVGGAVTPPVFSDWVSRGEGFTYWHFHNGVNGVGANWNLMLNNAGQGIQIRLYYTDETSENLDLEIPNTSDGDFYGIVSDITIGSVRITGGTQEYVGGLGNDYAEERYTMDDLVYAPFGGDDPPPVGEVPEPATLLLTGLGLTVAAWKRRRRA